MTNEEAKKMLKAKLECLIRETSGTDRDCNYKDCDECKLCYAQGNMGEQKEALELAIKALDQEPSEDAEVIKISKGAVKARQGRFVIYDVEWLKKNFYATEEKIYGQPKESCEGCISRKAELDGLASIAKAKAKSDAQKALMGRVMYFTEQLPPVTPKYTDEEIDRAQAIEQAYIDKMVELTVEEFKRPKGKWIDIEYYDYDSEWEEWTCYRPKCPFCNEEPKEYSNYCPNCGAKLKEEDPDY